VELKPLAQLLEDMLYEAGDAGLEVCLAEALLDPSGDERALRAEYTQRYERAVLSIEEHRGAPSFAGARGAPGFPEWLSLDYASYWSDAAGLIYVGLDHHPEAARLVGGGRPHPVRQQAITILPSAR
jgi:hypothetical protein